MGSRRGRGQNVKGKATRVTTSDTESTEPDRRAPVVDNSEARLFNYQDSAQPLAQRSRGAEGF